MYLNVSQCISIIITIHHHVLSPHRPNFFPMRNCLPQVVGACNQSNYIRPWGVIFLGESHHFSASGPKTKLHALHQLGAFVHELLLGNGCLLIDLQIHGSDGPGGCGNGELCAVRNTP